MKANLMRLMVIFLALAAGAYVAFTVKPAAVPAHDSAALIREAAAAQAVEQKQTKGLSGQALYDEAISVSKLLRDPASANNTLFESETALSGELKALIYEMLREGKTRDEIFDFMEERYGAAVRYRPDFNASTALLWAAPWILFVLAAGLYWRNLRRRRSSGKA